MKLHEIEDQAIGRENDSPEVAFRRAILQEGLRATRQAWRINWGGALGSAALTALGAIEHAPSVSTVAAISIGVTAVYTTLIQFADKAAGRVAEEIVTLAAAAASPPNLPPSEPVQPLGEPGPQQPPDLKA